MPTPFITLYLSALQLSDHIQRLLRDHDCVIIPDFGGLIADYEPARLHPVRHTLAPPAKRVAFNQALTRNDGLLVDALSRSLAISAAQARQQVRQAVATMQRELEAQQRTELPGIGVFRGAPDRGLDFEYTGSANLLTSSFGLPELTSRPVRATDALLARERVREAPQPLLAAGNRARLRRVFNFASVFVLAGLFLTANYQFAVQNGYAKWPDEWHLNANKSTTELARQPQAANLANTAFGEVALPDGSKVEEPEIAKPEPANAELAVAAATKKAVSARAVAPAVPAKKPVAATSRKPAPSVTSSSAAGTTISGVTNRFYVVVGSFNSLRSVEQARLNLARKGRVAKVLLPRRGSKQVRGTKHFRLTVADFSTQAAARQGLPALRKQYGSDILVYNY
ncbi:SPOR domain-containing protein [Hymenobacter koreensis]|uniref:SPOR domain-containing protein n=1 Tax=Hymenobacter koreensis TaxID=1084523 RepID=A0ABP8J7I8_9BACT